MDNRRKFFAFASRMKYINRWGLMRNNIRENIQEHSLDVAVIAHALAVISNVYYGENLDQDRVAVMAMYHDINEIITGDMPTPIKYHNRDIKEAYKEIERISKGKILDMLPDKMKHFYKPYLDINDEQPQKYRDIVRAADKISAYIKCVEERKSGNGEFIQAEKSLLSVITSMDIPEVQHFIKEFLPAYELTLDEMNT